MCDRNRRRNLYLLKGTRSAVSSVIVSSVDGFAERERILE
ncbi:hypothetical protein NJ7G_1982 [Natrinema sp. J7-2]|nr:hypothetical protein NJ7G_1982 [Natrinema sp. J7-2]